MKKGENRYMVNMFINNVIFFVLLGFFSLSLCDNATDNIISTKTNNNIAKLIYFC